MSRAGDDGVEDAFPAKKHIFHTGNGLDIHGTGGFHSSQITGIHDDLLTGLQVVFDNMAVKFRNTIPSPARRCMINPSPPKSPEPKRFWKKTERFTPASEARKPDFCTISSRPGEIW